MIIDGTARDDKLVMPWVNTAGGAYLYGHHAINEVVCEGLELSWRWCWSKLLTWKEHPSAFPGMNDIKTGQHPWRACLQSGCP